MYINTKFIANKLKCCFLASLQREVNSQHNTTTTDARNMITYYFFVVPFLFTFKYHHKKGDNKINVYFYWHTQRHTDMFKMLRSLGDSTTATTYAYAL